MTHSSKFRIVIGSEGVHLWVIEVAPEVLSETLKLKMRRRINKANEQLEHHDGGGVLVPVINMTRYGHCQKSVYLDMRDLLRDSKKLSTLGGILMITKDFDAAENESGFHDVRLRFIGLANLNSDPDRRLDPYMFNPSLDDENVNEERRAIIKISPANTPYQIRNGRIFVGGVEFGRLPRNYSVPDAVKVMGRLENTET